MSSYRLSFLLFIIHSIFSQSIDEKPTTCPNTCTTFEVGPGTGCAWMCNHCAEVLGTNNYYFTDGVCKYKLAGCEGSPQTGIQYTCCAGASKEGKNITVYLNNEDNNSTNNPPGFNQWVGGNEHGDPSGIKVNKMDTKKPYNISADTLFILTWYYDWGWYSGRALQGPWEDGETIVLPEIYKTWHTFRFCLF